MRALILAAALALFELASAAPMGSRRSGRVPGVERQNHADCPPPGASRCTTHAHLSPDAGCARHGFSALERRRPFPVRQSASRDVCGPSCDFLSTLKGSTYTFL